MNLLVYALMVNSLGLHRHRRRRPNLLGYALMVNSLALHRHRRRPPDRLAAAA